MPAQSDRPELVEGLAELKPEGDAVKYFGVNYCARKSCPSWVAWAWWPNFKTGETIHPDIVYRKFLRILGIEFKIIEWLPSKDSKTLWDLEVLRDSQKIRGGLINPSYLTWAVHDLLGNDNPGGSISINLTSAGHPNG